MPLMTHPPQTAQQKPSRRMQRSHSSKKQTKKLQGHKPSSPIPTLSMDPSVISIATSEREGHLEVLPDIPSRRPSVDLRHRTGDFAHDFTRLCEAASLDYIPPVVARRQPETWVNQTQLAKAEASLYRRSFPGNRRKNTVQKPPFAPNSSHDSVVSDGVESTDCLEAPATPARLSKSSLAHAAKERFHYFKPRVQVEYSPSGKAVTEVYVEGWGVDNAVMSILCQCCLVLEEFVLLQLWNVALDPGTFHTLTSCLPHLHSLRTLVLDTTPLTAVPVSALLDDAMPLTHLSLRFCQLGPLQACSLGRGLGTAHAWNKRLVTLNLSNNAIGDVGAGHLAQGLMTNRCLVVLNLASNRIGDDGAAALAEALSSFALSKEQKSERNHMVMKTMKFQVLGMDVVTDLRRASNRQLMPKEKEAMRNRKRSTREEKNPMLDTQRLKEWHSPRRAKKDSKHPPLERQRTLKVPGQPAEVTLTRQRSFTDGLSISGPVEDGHPLLEVVTRQEGGQVWVLGNRSLLSLNLARNNIGDRGMGLLWDMLQEQVVVWSHQHQPPGGLKRLVVHRNAVAATQGTLQHIQHYMHLRDPLHRVPLLSLTKHNVPPCAIPPIQI